METAWQIQTRYIETRTTTTADNGAAVRSFPLFVLNDNSAFGSDEAAVGESDRAAHIVDGVISISASFQQFAIEGDPLAAGHQEEVCATAGPGQKIRPLVGFLTPDLQSAIQPPGRTGKDLKIQLSGMGFHGKTLKFSPVIAKAGAGSLGHKITQSGRPVFGPHLHQDLVHIPEFFSVAFRNNRQVVVR